MAGLDCSAVAGALSGYAQKHGQPTLDFY